MRKLLLITIMLLMIATPAMACPPAWWVDKVNWQKANNYTDFNTTCWMDGDGALHNASIETHADQFDILGYKYGDVWEFYTIKIDDKVVVSGMENLDEKHRQHEAVNNPMGSFSSN
jgi:hypothetical protein